MSAVPAIRSSTVFFRTAAALVALAAVCTGFIVVDDDKASAAPAGCRMLPVDQDAPLRSDLARAEFGVDGTGVTVGIISNTWAQATQNSTPQQNIDSGLLPGPGNPCGYPEPVEVLIEGPSAEADDEGRAMAQLVHGVAPGASLLFASGTADGGMISAIDALVAAHADVIVDDISVYTEPWFQESSVSSRIGQITEQGVAYFSAAANETVIAQTPLSGQSATPVNGWRTDAYRPTVCSAAISASIDANIPGATYDCMDFDTSGAADPTDTIIADFSTAAEPGATVLLPLWLQWAEPFGNAQADFSLAVEITGAERPDGTSEVALAVSEQAVSDSSVDVMEPTIDTSPEVFGSTVTMDFSIVRFTTAGVPDTEITPPVGFFGTLNGPQWIGSAEYWQSTASDTIGRTIVGHNGGPSVITVAATDGTDDDRIDYYSSLGPVTYYLTPQSTDGSGAFLASPDTQRKPTLLSVDAISNTVLGIPTADPGVFTFRGTSAASPNAAAVAALALQLDSTLTPQQVSDLLTTTATPIAPPYLDVSGEDSVGAGLINAQALLQAVAGNLPVPAANPPPIRLLAATGAPVSSEPILIALSLVSIGLLLRASRRPKLRQRSTSKQRPH